MPFYQLAPQAIVTSVPVTGKAQLMELLANQFAKNYALDSDVVHDRLLEREALGSTGFGRSIAIPHGKLPGLDGPRAVFVKLMKPIDFESVDGQPVSFAMGLMSPESGGAGHLQALARISRLLRDDKIIATIKGTQDRDAIYAVLADEHERDAA